MRPKLLRPLAIVIVTLAAAAFAVVVARRLEHGWRRDRATAESATHFGPLAVARAQSAFWLVLPTPANLARIRTGQVPAFADGMIGLATPIHPAGYLITAAHAVRPGMKLLADIDGRRELVDVTVVFQGNGQNPNDDFCILRIPPRPVQAASFATRPPARGDRVFFVAPAASARVAIAGQVLRPSATPPHARASALESDFPLEGGEAAAPSTTPLANSSASSAPAAAVPSVSARPRW